MSHSLIKKVSIWLTTVPLTLLLVSVILCSTVEKLHSTMLDIGENHWSGYSELRQPAVEPDCDPNAQAAHSDKEADELLDDLFGTEETSVSNEAREAARTVCIEKHQKYENIVKQQQDGSLKAFVSIERAIGTLAADSVAFGREFLVFIFIFCGLATTLQRQHLGLRSPKTKRDDRASQIAQCVGNLIVFFSFLAYYRQDLASGVDNVSNLPLYWMIAFGLMAASNLLLICRPLENGEKSSIAHMLLGIPLYAYMAIICGFYFAFIEQHFAGVAIYLNQMTEHASLYTNVALYVFCGMMLKNTNIADRFLAILRPWKLSPEFLAFIIILLSAIPTAYSGASGIFVIATGAIIYREMKLAGTRDSLALATTAMSGSMGIVLSPCLIVVIIAALNKDVTTTELFSAGINVFLVNIFVLGIVLFATKRSSFHCENPIIALPKMGRAILPILPYLAIGAVVILCFHFGLHAAFDEYSAPYLLPFILLVLLIYDRIIAKRQSSKPLHHDTTEVKNDIDTNNTLESKDVNSTKQDDTTHVEPTDPKPVGILRSLINSVNATSINSGGLLALMTLSICVGGIIDRANLTELLPQTFSSPILAMGMLFIILVFIGMIMDPYGAVILVSATLTQIAYHNGIAPTHFWVTVLCAFELGYLTPPVALNQLLTRQVVGDDGYAHERGPDRPKNFWLRHERVLLPVAIKGVVLILVAFMPLILNALHWLLK